MRRRKPELLEVLLKHKVPIEVSDDILSWCNLIPLYSLLIEAPPNNDDSALKLRSRIVAAVISQTLASKESETQQPRPIFTSFPGLMPDPNIEYFKRQKKEQEDLLNEQSQFLDVVVKAHSLKFDGEIFKLLQKPMHKRGIVQHRFSTRTVEIVRPALQSQGYDIQRNEDDNDIIIKISSLSDRSFNHRSAHSQGL